MGRHLHSNALGLRWNKSVYIICRGISWYAEQGRRRFPQPLRIPNLFGALKRYNRACAGLLLSRFPIKNGLCSNSAHNLKRMDAQQFRCTPIFIERTLLVCNSKLASAWWGSYKTMRYPYLILLYSRNGAPHDARTPRSRRKRKRRYGPWNLYSRREIRRLKDRPWASLVRALLLYRSLR